MTEPAPALPWVEGQRRYAGWIPNVRTHLSFSMIGAARDASVVSLPVSKRKRVVVLLQRRIVNDFPIPMWLARWRIPSIVVYWLLEAETEPTVHPRVQGGEVVGERDRQGMLRGRIHYLPLLTGAQLTSRRDVRGIRDVIGTAVALDRTARINDSPGNREALDEALGELRSRVLTLAEGGGDHVAVEMALMRTGECRIWFPGPVDGKTDAELDLIASHAYYFVKDAVHAHTHHDPTSDQITPLVRDDPQVDPEPGHSHEEEWRRETLWSLSREIERLNRDGGLTEQRRSLGIIAYAEAFQAGLLGHVRAETESGFALGTLVHDYDFKHLKDSIKADVDVNATRLTQSIQLTIAAVATFLSALALVSSLVSAHNSGELKAANGAPIYLAHLGWMDVPLPLLSWNPALTAIGIAAGLLLVLVVFVFDKRARFRTRFQRFVSQFGRALGVSITRDPAWQLGISLGVHATAFVLALGVVGVCLHVLFP